MSGTCEVMFLRRTKSGILVADVSLVFQPRTTPQEDTACFRHLNGFARQRFLVPPREAVREVTYRALAHVTGQSSATLLQSAAELQNNGETAWIGCYDATTTVCVYGPSTVEQLSDLTSWLADAEPADRADGLIERVTRAITHPHEDSEATIPENRPMPRLKFTERNGTTYISAKSTKRPGG